MASIVQPWLFLCIFFVFLISIIPFCSSQSDDDPRNIEVFYPFESLPSDPTPTPTTPTNNPPSLFPPTPPSPPPSKSKSSSSNTVLKAVAGTAASTLVVAGLLLFFIRRCVRRRRGDANNVVNPYSANRAAVVVRPYDDGFTRFDGNVRGLIVDENGLDVVYWRKLEGVNPIKGFEKEVLGKDEDGERIGRGARSRKTERVQETPLLRGKSSTSHSRIHSDVEDRISKFNPKPPAPPMIPMMAIAKKESPASAPAPPPPMMAIPKKESTAPPPPPPPMMAIPKKESTAPPPPPPPMMAIPKKESTAPPPPPPPSITKKNPAPPPPPPRKVGSAAVPSKPPPGPMRNSGEITSSGQNSTETENGNGQVKLKPLHWDKVNPNPDHSMVWHKIDNGSFRFDGDLMEALFGSVATNRKSPRGNMDSSNPSTVNAGPPPQIFILDPRKSQNTAIVLRSLTISRREIHDALIEGHGLNADTLEKLTRIAPTKEEESQILAFTGDSTKLADAESFLYHLLKAVPSAFPRLNAMHFRSDYGSEIRPVKELIKTLELGCIELRTRGLFLKLLEAVLKAGNRMNAGTARGNAQAFNLTALRKLSDVKSTDGKTTLLRFVVEEVVRAEGKRGVLNRNRSLNRSNSSSSSMHSDNSGSKEEKEREYTMLGLPVVGGLSSEFSNVKKAATIDYDVFARTCSVLTARLAEIQQILAQCAINGGGGFVKEMKGFTHSAEEELKTVREEQAKVMELVKKTTDYYQAAGASKDRETNPLQLFVIVKDFLGMVDQVCVDITRDMQKKKTSKTPVGSSSSSPTKSPVALRSAMKFPYLPEHFMSDKSKSSSSESSEDS